MPRNVLLPLTLCLALLASACGPDELQPQPPQPLPAVDEPDALAVDLRAAGDVALARGAVTLEAQVLGGGALPERVELREGTELLSTLQAPPWRWRWEGSEGTHTLHAVVVRGAQQARSAELTLALDHTAPRVVTRTPGPGESNVALSAPIEVTFSEPLAPASVRDDTVQLAASAGSLALAKTLSLSADGRTLRIAPVAPLAAPLAVTVALGAGLTDLAGNPLQAAPDVWAWQYPAWRTLGSALPSGIPVALKLDPAGNLVVAVGEWADEDPQAAPWVRVWRHVAAGWEDLGVAGTLGGEGWNSREHSFDLDADGEPVFAWSERKDDVHRLHVRRRLGGHWQDVGETMVLEDGGLQRCNLGVALHARTGTLRLALGEETAGVGSFVRVLAWEEGAWRERAPALTVGQVNLCSTVDPQLSVLNDGTLVVAFERERADRVTNVGVALWKDGAWKRSPELDASAGTTDARHPALEVAGGLFPVLAWNEPESTGAYRVHVRWYIPSVNFWLDYAGVSFPMHAGPYAPLLAVGADQQPMVGLVDSDVWGGTHFGLRHYTFTAGWVPVGPREDVVAPGLASGSHQLALGRDGTPWVAFQAYDGHTFGVYVQSPNR